MKVKIINNQALYVSKTEIGVGFGAQRRAAIVRDTLGAKTYPTSLPDEEFSALEGEVVEVNTKIPWRSISKPSSIEEGVKYVRSPTYKELITRNKRS